MYGAIALGGRLTLTREALVFKTHNVNLLTGTHTTPVDAIRGVTCSGINKISVILTDDEVVTYIVFRRKLLARKLREVSGLDPQAPAFPE